MDSAPQVGEVSQHLFDAVVGFVDLAGFTAATERLGRLGPRGTEQLGELINDLFTPAIDIVHRCGGEIGWFAGDAIGVLFDRSVTADEIAVRALGEVSRTITTMTPVDTAAGEVEMAVKVGMAAGPVSWAVMSGAQDVGWFAGAAVDRATDAEHFAEPGALVVHASLGDALTDGIGDLVPLAPEFARLDEMSTTLLPTVETRPLAGRGALAFQPPRVARLARAGDVGFLDQHRPVTSVFVRMPAPTHHLDTLHRIRSFVETQGGWLSSVTEGDKGAVLLALFGAPTALADRHRRAITSALGIRELVDGVSIGVTSGRAYTGRVGSAARWDYSLVGDRVNTAARLMQAAGPAEILVDRATLEGVGGGVRVVEERSLELKGKSEPEPAAVVDGLPAVEFDADDGGLFVGRETEQAALHDLMARAGMAIVVAAAGAGKSRLLRRVLAASTARLVPVRMEPSDRSRPFSLWRELLPRMVDVDASDAHAEIERRLGDDPRVSLAAVLLGRPGVVDPALAAADAEDRDEILAGLVVDLLTSSPDARTVVIEDLHWIDDASRDLLQRIVSRLPGLGVAIIATSRPDVRLERLHETGAVRSLPLEPIDAESMARLADALWIEEMGTAPAPAVVEGLVERAAGNPLFCEQLVSFSRTSGVQPGAAALPAEGALPVTLTDLLLARLDALPEAAGFAASYGAVFGAAFSVEDLLGAFGGRPGAEKILGGVEILRDQGVVVGLHEHRFAHSLLGEAAYERLSFGLRAELHLHVVEFLEVDSADDIEALAHHARATDDVVRKRTYFRRAGDAAAAGYAHDLSRQWYVDLLPLLDDDVEAAAIEVALGDIEVVAGAMADARARFESALDRLPTLERSHAEVSLARVLVGLGEAAEAFERLDGLIAASFATQDWTALHDAMETKADLATMLGDLERAEQVERRLADLVTDLGADHPAAAPLEFLVPLLWMRGEVESAAREYERQFDAFIARGDLVNAGMNAADLAGLAFERRDLDAVFSWLERARDLFDRAGHARALMRFVRGNEIVVRLGLGDHEGARSVAVERLRDGLDLDDPSAVGETLALLARTEPVAADDPDPRDLARRAVAIGHRVANNDLVSDAVVALAEATSASDGLDAGADLLDVACDRFDAPPEVAIRRAALRLRQGVEPAGEPFETLSSLAEEESEIGALAAAALASVRGDGVDVAIDRCRRAHSAFPSAQLERALADLGVTVASAALPVPHVAPGRAEESIGELVSRADATLPSLVDWATTARTVVGSGLSTTEGVG